MMKLARYAARTTRRAALFSGLNRAALSSSSRASAQAHEDPAAGPAAGEDHSHGAFQDPQVVILDAALRHVGEHG